MKKVVGSIRLDLAQYREMQVFSQFGGELDAQTEKDLKYGASLMQLLRQHNMQPMNLWEQVVTLICATERMFTDIPTKDVKQTQKNLLEYFYTHHGTLCMKIQHKRVYSPEIRKEVISVAKTFFAK